MLTAGEAKVGAAVALAAQVRALADDQQNDVRLLGRGHGGRYVALDCLFSRPVGADGAARLEAPGVIADIGRNPLHDCFHIFGIGVQGPTPKQIGAVAGQRANDRQASLR